MTETNKLSDGFLATWRTCPYCGSENTRAMVSLVNAGYLLGESAVLLFLLALAVVTEYTPNEVESKPFTLKRVCRQCRGKFWPKREQETPINCGQCGYNLTGNVSGICPECGWALPEEVKQQVRGSRPGGFSEEHSCEHRRDSIHPGR